MKKILLVEDEENIAKGIILNLEMVPYQVFWAKDGTEALDLWMIENPDLIILDLMIPKIDGFSVLKKIRATDEQIPVLILSAKDATPDRIKGLKQGCDDYLGKPFDLDELLLRVEKLLIRMSKKVNDLSTDKNGANDLSITQYIFGQNIINFSAQKAQTPSGDVELTSQEIILLKLFIQNSGRVLTRESLLKAGWGYQDGTESRTLDNFIVRMRKYFEIDPKKPQHFVSVRSIGYKFIN
jgi:two-component system alkaline phosphatase synthesis response regulator PhoP